jgi:signal transduction histidine kinase
MLFTILRNLTSNAVKFTRSGDEITIVSKKINDMMEITVHDTGIGIKEEHLKLLFKTDVHNSEIGTEQEKGTGLGLILCKELVEKNGGKIHVESQLGNGSSFIFTVPLSSTKVMS